MLLDLVGEGGTLCMPTHPLYKGDRGFLDDKTDLELVYQSWRTASSVGLLTEMFRRDPMTLRSEHPLCSLAARGPLSSSLLKGNLNDDLPLPHGRHSGYFRFCAGGGTVVGIGLPLYRYATVLHCAEECADADWPVKNFFRVRHFIVESQGGQRRQVSVRERRPEYVRSLALGRLRADALRAGVLREQTVKGLRLDALDAKGFFEMMLDKQRHGPYPFVYPRLAMVGVSGKLDPFA
jgi:aminoglycoside 3-N-acetyltransferase